MSTTRITEEDLRNARRTIDGLASSVGYDSIDIPIRHRVIGHDPDENADNQRIPNYEIYTMEEYISIGGIRAMRSEGVSEGTEFLVSEAFRKLENVHGGFFNRFISDGGFWLTLVSGAMVFYSRNKLNKFVYHPQSNNNLSLDNDIISYPEVSFISDSLEGIDQDSLIYFSRERLHIDVISYYRENNPSVDARNFSDFICDPTTDFFIEELMSDNAYPDSECLKYSYLTDFQKRLLSTYLDRIRLTSGVHDPIFRSDVIIFIDQKKIYIKMNGSSLIMSYDVTNNSIRVEQSSSSLLQLYRSKATSNKVFIPRISMRHVLGDRRSIPFQNQDDLDRYNECLNNSDVFEESIIFQNPNQKILDSSKEGSLEWCIAYSKVNNDPETQGCLSYIERICLTADLDVHKWNLKNIFFNKDNNIKVKDHRDLNEKIFQTRMPGDFIDFDGAVSEGPRRITSSDIENIVNKTNERYEEWSHDIDESVEKLKERIKKIRGLLTTTTSKFKKLRIAQDSKNGNEFYNREKMKDQLDKIASSGLFEFIGVDENFISFINTEPFYLKHTNYGKRHNILIGKFIIKVRLSNFSVKMICVDRNETPFTKYKHPYLPTNGNLCFGAEKSKTCDYYNTNALYSLLILVSDLMTSYDGSEPHRSLDYFTKVVERKNHAKKILGMSGDEFETNRKNFNYNQYHGQCSNGILAITSDRKIINNIDARSYLKSEVENV